MSSPHETIPNTYRDVPAGFSEHWVDDDELRAAGFHHGPKGEHKPGTAPADELMVDGVQSFTPTEAATIIEASKFLALRDPDGKIVATWDEGRWWTPDESEAFIAAIVEELRK